ncbi:integrase [Streptomyces sp. NBC_00647]|uniref:integrase n=1 Tax=Streptomyces sp. NBC_00647 TaxID=2975796 RepID=UPI0032460EAB
MDTVFLARLFVLFLHRARHPAGAHRQVTRHVTAEWVTQQARNALMRLGDVRTAGIRYLIRDNAGYFTEAFDAVFSVLSARVVPILPGTPRMNAITERWVGSCRREATDRILIAGERHLRLVIDQYADHHNKHPAAPITRTTKPRRCGHARPSPPPMSNRVPSGAIASAAPSTNTRMSHKVTGFSARTRASCGSPTLHHDSPVKGRP